MSLKDLVIHRWPTEREIQAAMIAVDALISIAGKVPDDITRRVSEAALRAATVERHAMRYEAKRRS